MAKDVKDNIYCTIVQGKYAIRAIVLFESFQQYNANKFIILSLDEESDDLLKNYRHENLTILNYSKFKDWKSAMECVLPKRKCPSLNDNNHNIDDDGGKLDNDVSDNNI